MYLLDLSSLRLKFSILLLWVPERVSRSRRAGAESTGGGGWGEAEPPVISVPALRERETSGTKGNHALGLPENGKRVEEKKNIGKQTSRTCVREQME